MSFLKPLLVNADGRAARYTDQRVVFHDPFTLGCSPNLYPAGTYLVETEHCAYEGNEHTAHVRTSTVLVLPTASGTRDLHVSGCELDAALSADAQHENASDPNENPDRGQADGQSKKLSSWENAASDDRSSLFAACDPTAGPWFRRNAAARGVASESFCRTLYEK